MTQEAPNYAATLLIVIGCEAVSRLLARPSLYQAASPPSGEVMLEAGGQLIDATTGAHLWAERFEYVSGSCSPDPSNPQVVVEVVLAATAGGTFAFNEIPLASNLSPSPGSSLILRNSASAASRR